MGICPQKNMTKKDEDPIKSGSHATMAPLLMELVSKVNLPKGITLIGDYFHDLRSAHLSMRPVRVPLWRLQLPHLKSLKPSNMLLNILSDPKIFRDKVVENGSQKAWWKAMSYAFAQRRDYAG